MDINETRASLFKDWDGPKELVVTIDGDELLRGDIVGFNCAVGEERCSNPECIDHLMPGEIVQLVFRVAPPVEP